MAYTDWKEPGTLSSENSGAGPSWSNPTNAATSDNAYATVTMSGAPDSDFLWARNFGFTTADIPNGSTINAIEVEVEAKLSGGVMFLGAYVGKTNATATGDRIFFFGPSLTIPSSDTTSIQEDAPSLWGQTWTPAEIHASTFGALLFVEWDSGAGTVSVDRVRIRVDYTSNVASLTPADGRSLTSSDQATLGAKSSVTVNDALNASSSDAVTLLMKSALAVADALHGLASDEPFVGIMVSPVDGAHTHASDQVTLVAKSALAVADGLHAHEADAVGLAVRFALAVADALSAHIADSPLMFAIYVAPDFIITVEANQLSDRTILAA